MNAKMKNNDKLFDYDDSYNYTKMSFRTKKWELLKIQVGRSYPITYNPFSSSIINVIKGILGINNTGGILIEEDGRCRRIICSQRDNEHGSIHILNRVTDDFYSGLVIRRPWKWCSDDDSGWHIEEKNKYPIFAIRSRCGSETYLVNAILENNILSITTKYNEYGTTCTLNYNIQTNRIEFRCDTLTGPIVIRQMLLEVSKNIIQYLSK